MVARSTPKRSRRRSEAFLELGLTSGRVAKVAGDSHRTISFLGAT
jgi:hypothetical protein